MNRFDLNKIAILSVELSIIDHFIYENSFNAFEFPKHGMMTMDDNNNKIVNDMENRFMSIIVETINFRPFLKRIIEMNENNMKNDITTKMDENGRNEFRFRGKIHI